VYGCIQGQLWDAAWSQDCQYVAGSTLRPGASTEVKGVPRPGQDTGSWKSCLYYWRQDGSLVCSVECQHTIKKIIVDPANSAYIISLGMDGQVRVSCHVLCNTLIPSLDVNRAAYTGPMFYVCTFLYTSALHVSVD
jgi:hypothetical protein